MPIEFLDLKKINAKYLTEYVTSCKKVIEKGWLILGDEVKQFEEEYATFSKVSHVIGLANGLDALTLALRATGVSNEDEVIVPSNTYIASWLAVSQVGAIPVPVEPRIETYNINPDLIEAAITPKTKAVMAVNLYGQSAELSKIKRICDKHKLILIEDNAQSQGANCEGKMAGTFGAVNGTSFYPGKNLGALGDGGAVTTDNAFIAEHIKMLRNYGSAIKYYNEEKGYNSRLDEIQAAFLRIRLRHLHAENELRNRLATKYNELLTGTGDLVLPMMGEGCTSVYHIYLVRTKRRDELQKYLLSENIGTMIHYPVPPHMQKAYKDLGYSKGDFPIAEEIAETCLSLPMGPHLSIEEVERVSNKINCFFQTN